MINKFAGAVWNGLRGGLSSVVSPYAVPVTSLAQGRHVEGLGAAAGLGLGGLAIAGASYAGGNAHGVDQTLSRYKIPDLHDQLLYHVQQSNPELTLNQAQYEAAKVYADVADKPKEWIDLYMDDVGATQNDSWSQMRHAPLSQHGRDLIYRDLKTDAPLSDRGYVYVGNGKWEAGAPWQGNSSDRIYG